MKNKRGYKKEAFCLIVNIILSIVAIAFLIGSLDIGVVSGSGYEVTPNGVRAITDPSMAEGNNEIYTNLGAAQEAFRKIKTPPSSVLDVSKTSASAVTGVVKTIDFGKTVPWNTPNGEVLANSAKFVEGSNWNLVNQGGEVVGTATTEQLSAAGFSSANAGAQGLSFWQQIQGETILSGAFYGLIWGGMGAMVGSFLGGNGAKAGFFAGFAGSMAYTLSKTMLAKGGTWQALGQQHAGLGLVPQSWAPLIGIGVGVAVFVLLYKKESKEIVTFNCLPWQAPIGGDDCEKCNTNDKNEPCSLYQCKSLGQACELLNPGTKEEKCDWVNPHDVTSPGIKPWEEPLTSGYSYTDVRIRPPGDGSEPGRMRVIKQGGECVKAWAPLEFGIETTEPAQCKIDYNHTNSFENMTYYFGESPFYLYNHTQRMNLPSPSAIEAAAPEIKNDGIYSLYVRCKDYNGNENVDEFVIRMCVDKGPDTTPPKIESTSIVSGMPVQFGIDNLSLEVYVNEPAECKWSREDKAYAQMENQMSCSTQVWEMNSNLLYTCRTRLTAIKDREENNFYFRCKDQPFAEESSRNVNQQSFRFVLKGTESLNIMKVRPNETVYGSTTTIPVEIYVETANGYNNGDALCYYSRTGVESDYVKFFESESNQHRQRQDLTEGDYKYYIKCVDLGGNTEYNSTEFSVRIDDEAPVIARAYNENGQLKIITNEKSDCRYSTQNCNFNFEDGISMAFSNQTEHSAEWKPSQNYYIRCSDTYGSMPNPNTCSMIIRPYDKISEEVIEL